MNERFTKDERESHAVTAFIRYSQEIRELEVSDDEIQACLDDNSPLPKEYLDALKQPIDPEKVRKTLTGEYQPKMPPSLAGLVARLRESHSQRKKEVGGGHSPLIQLDGYQEFIQHQNLSLAASEKSSPKKSFELRVLEGEITLDLHFESDRRYLTILVWDRSGEPSSLLDGAEILDNEMNALATIKKNGARILAKTIEKGLIIRMASGDFLEAH